MPNLVSDPTPFLSLSTDCSDGSLCALVQSLTGSQRTATIVAWVVAKPLAIVGILVLGYAVRWLVFRVINRLTEQAAEGNVPGVLARSRAHQMFLEANPVAVERRRQRATTTGSLLKSVSTGIIAVVVLFMVVSKLGYDIAPLIASAGILGVALGFGAQSLVKDFLSGIFMTLEDQYGVGDVVDLGEASGTVEAVGLRITRLRDVNGTVWYVRNGEVLRVGNMSQNWARTVLDINVAYSEDLQRVRTVLRDLAHELFEDPNFHSDIIEEPEVWGVERLDPDGVVVRVVLKTAPMEQWNVAREMRERIKQRFDALGIEIPLPQRVVWHRTDTDTDTGTGTGTRKG
ncbi:MAG: mechanosensitive ion channel family protein [Nocardioidaceae bacterium]